MALVVFVESITLSRRSARLIIDLDMLAAPPRLAVAALLILALGSEVALAQCSQFSRCSECTLDATVFANDVPLACSWCSDTSSCVDSSATTCQGAITPATGSQQCPDTCALARVSGNIYLCRPGMIVSFLFALILLLSSAAFFVWLRALQQRPWRFVNIHDVADTVISREGGALRDLFAPVPKSIESELRRTSQEDLIATRDADGIEGGGPRYTCPICDTPETRMLGPGEVCFWCSVLRWGLFPFAAGITSSVLCILLLLAVSIKPWFADVYYAVMLTLPLLFQFVFVAAVFRGRVPITGDKHKRATMFFALSLLLRCRTISNVLAEVPATAAEVARDAAAADASGRNDRASFLTEHVPSSLELRSATTYLVELETSLRPEFRQMLKDELKNDELVVWWQRPSQTVAFIEHRWVVHLCASFILISLWLFAVGGLPPNRFPQLLLAPANLRAIAVVMFVFFSVVLITLITGLSRLYVLTNERVLCIVKGVLGSCNVASTPLSTFTGATVFGYQEFGYSVLGLEWDTKTVGLRRMPQLKTNKFVGVLEIDKLVSALRRHAPQLKTQSIKSELQHLRWVWSLHVGLLLLILEAAPVFLVSSMIFPVEIGTFALLLFTSLIVALIQRGVRVFGTTTRPIDTAGDWQPFGEQGFQLDQLFKVAGVVKSLAQGHLPSSPSPQRASNTA